MYNVAPQCSPNRNEISAADSSLRAAMSGSVSRRLSGRGDAGSRRGRLGSSRFGEEERDDAISGVAADDPARIDDALVRGAYQTANEREVLRSRKTTRQRRRRFQVGHQDRRRATIGTLNGPHPFEMRQVRGRGRGGELRHPRRGFDHRAEPARCP